MAEGCGASCAKVLLIVFNFIFWLSGAAILAIGIWILVDPNFGHYFDILETVDASGPLIKYAAYVLCGVGAFVFIVGFLGCCGAIKESRCLLGLYMFCMVLVLIGELGAGVMALIYKNKYMAFLVVIASGELIAGVLAVVVRDEYIFFLVLVMAGELAAGIVVLLYKNQVKEQLQKTWMEKLEKEYGGQTDDDVAFTGAMDIFQIKLDCCGVDGAENYAASAWRTKEADKPDGLMVPYSCCVLKKEAKEKTNVTADDVEKPEECRTKVEGSFHSKGCYSAAIEWFDTHAIILIGVGIGIACLELFGFIFAVLLCRNATPRD